MSTKISDLTAKGSAIAATDLVEIAQVSGGGYVSKSVTGQDIIDAASQNLQSIPIVVSTNTTAENNKVYHVIANATFTDPTGVDGRGYFVVVRFASSCVLGGNSYISGETIYRIFHSGSWLNIALRPSTYVPISRTINGQALTSNITLTATNVGAPSGSGTSTGTNTGDQNISGLVPYTGATANVDLGTYHLDAAKGTFSHNGSTDTLTANHTSGSGIGLLITKGGNNEGLKVNKTSGSGNAATIIGTLEATTIVKTGGTSTEFLMADGSTNTAVVPTTRNITINGTTQDLSADRTFSAVMLTGLPGVANTGLNGATRYFTFSGVAVATSEITRRIIICNSLTLKNFYIYTSTAQPATGSHVLTVLKNGVATSITVTIASGSAAGLFSDTTNSESFAQGDAISIQAVNNASTNSCTIVSFQIGSL